MASVAPFTAGQLANVANAGRIDLTNGGGAAQPTPSPSPAIMPAAWPAPFSTPHLATTPRLRQTGDFARRGLRVSPGSASSMPAAPAAPRWRRHHGRPVDERRHDQRQRIRACRPGRSRRLRISALQGRRQRRQRRELVSALDAGAGRDFLLHQYRRRQRRSPSRSTPSLSSRRRTSWCSRRPHPKIRIRHWRHPTSHRRSP